MRGFLRGRRRGRHFQESLSRRDRPAHSLEHIVLETDAPYLAPVPHRGQRNESAYLPLVATKIAELKGLTFNEVEEATTHNARNLYQI